MNKTEAHNITLQLEKWARERDTRMKGVENLTDEQWTTLGLVLGFLRDYVHHMKLCPSEPDYHNRKNWHPLYTIYADFDKHLCIDDHNNNFLCSNGWDAHFDPYEYVKKWRQ